MRSDSAARLLTEPLSAAPLGRRRVAVVGAGISGLAAAYRLDALAEVTLYEADGRFGGHSHTVDVTVDGVRHPVDTGFLVFNERTYPRLIALLAELGVETALSDMSFSVQAAADGIEWSGSDLPSVFAQRRNLVRPAFWRMLVDVLRFNALATRLARDGDHAARGQQTIGAFLAEHRFSTAFRDWYFLPMIGCIWSCPTAQMLDFPVETLIRFCHNHGLLQVTGRPRWFTVRDGSRTYVERLLAGISDARRSTPVQSVRRLAAGGTMVSTAHGSERYDDVVFACHSDQTLALLGSDASPDERSVLDAIRYQRNRAVLHTDASVLPKNPAAWAAWNHASGAGPGGGRDKAADRDGVCLHYLINRLQPIATATPVIVTLNPLWPPRPDSVQGEFDYAHPVFDVAAIAAQRRLPSIQGCRDTWFCGAWTRYGFHEDGLLSALNVVDRLQRRWAAAPGESHLERDAAPMGLAA